jgi:methionine synthase I (cobalamin-dependent)
MPDFLQLLESKHVVLLDGAMGTELDKRGLMGQGRARVVALLRAATDLPIAAQPNASRPQLIGDKTVFDMEPGPFAEGVAECVRHGARIVGGCCGTTPAHIEAVRQRLSDASRS